MNIEKVEMYLVCGKYFPSLQKATDHVQGRVNSLVNEMLCERKVANAGLSMSASIPVTEFILANARQFVSMLQCLIDAKSVDKEEDQ